MSLDVYLTPSEEVTCPHCSKTFQAKAGGESYWANITHNLATMADKAGIYKCLWRPEEIGITKASQLIEPLSKGLQKLKENPEYFKQFDSSNGWGLYDNFVPWVEKYLAACRENPDSFVSVSR